MSAIDGRLAPARRAGGILGNVFCENGTKIIVASASALEG